MEELTSFQRDLLRKVAVNGPCSGQTISGAFDREVTHGRLYPSLDTLAEAGFIEKRVREHDDRTNEYEVARRGRDALYQMSEAYEKAWRQSR